MTEERWREIKQQIKTTFGLASEYNEALDPGTAEVVEFISPQGKMKARFVTRPRMLDKKTSYSNRIGSGVKVDYVYSETESVSHLEIFIFSEERNDWQKMGADSLF
jgi:hypothetical protein